MQLNYVSRFSKGSTTREGAQLPLLKTSIFLLPCTAQRLKILSPLKLSFIEAARPALAP